MFTKACLAVLASVALTSNGVLASGHHHAQRHQHENKRELVYQSTETVTDITWVTVTVDPNEQTSTVAPVVDAPSTTSSPVASSSAVAFADVSSPSASSVVTSTTSISLTSVVAPTTLASSAVIPTTLVTSTSALTPASSASAFSFANPNAAVVASGSSAVAATTTAATATTSSVADSTNKRGAAYNTASLVSPLIGSGSHINWAYNWGQEDDGLSDIDSSLEFVPMLWSTRDDFVSTWDANVKSAISDGAKNLLSFNEPDNTEQADMTASAAASAFIQYMNPYSGQVGLGSPAITNSATEGEGTSWLREWVSACGGQCLHTFCAAHWYSPADSSVFLDFVSDVYDACGNKPVWITEFAPTGADDDAISSFLEEVQDALDNDSNYSFVERYAYFYVSDGVLVDGTSASSYGNTFAYGS